MFKDPSPSQNEPIGELSCPLRSTGGTDRVPRGFSDSTNFWVS
jgi:hypothetical protein